MEFISLNSHISNISVLGVSESTRDRRSAINSAWSDEEAAERQRLAIQMQMGLAAIISINPGKNPLSKRTFELAS